MPEQEQMVPGPRLDAWLAKALKPRTVTWLKDGPENRACYIDAGGRYISWNASTDFALAREVIEAMRERGWLWSGGQLLEGGYWSQFEATDSRTVAYIDGDEFAGAVALAACRALGGE